MSELTINDLPNELITEILRRVDRSSQKNAVLTCSLWKEIIESSCSWPLVLYHQNRRGFDEPWINILMTTNRKFHTIKIDGLLEIGKNRIIEIFKRLGLKVLKLYLIESCLDKLTLFAELVTCLPNLEHLIIYRTTTLDLDVPPERDLPELNKLKTLEIVMSEYTIIQSFLRAQKLETIKILGSAYPTPTETSYPIAELLKSQEKLTTLAVRSIHYETDHLFCTGIMSGPMPFQLTKLSLADIKLQETPNHYNHLINFMKHHSKTVKELELGQTFPDLVYEFVFANFKNFKSLLLRINELPKDLSFYVRLEENRSINNLILVDSPPNSHLINGCPPSLIEFFKHVPNVTNLTLLEYSDRETVLIIARILTKLKELNVNFFSGSVFNGVHFPKLTSLNIHELDDEIEWDEFTKDNSGITMLSIDRIFYDSLKCNAIEEITRNLRLQTLKIGEGFWPDKTFYDIIRRNCSHLKILALDSSCARDDDISELSDVPGLRFYDNSRWWNSLQFWNDDDYDGRLPNELDDDLDEVGPFDIH